LKSFLAALAIFLPIAGNCAWIDAQGKTISDTPSMRSSDDFGVQLVLTASEKEFRRSWNSAAGTPTLNSTASIHQGESISGVLIFSGCEPGLTRNCNVSVEFTLQAPDGSITLAGSGPVWSASPPKARELFLGQASVSIGFTKDDAPGNYKLVAKVTDNVSRKTLQLIYPFSVTK
jgi:hypothetical protein